MTYGVYRHPEEVGTARVLADLTDQQQVIVRLLATGLVDKEIAHCLYRSRQTIRNTLKSVYKRTGMVGRVRLARWVWEQERHAPDDIVVHQAPVPHSYAATARYRYTSGEAPLRYQEEAS